MSVDPHDVVMETYTGRKFWPLAPRAEDVHIDDIARHLSLINRYLGATIRPLSVARHSVMVARALAGADLETRMAGLLHDAAEAYLFDAHPGIKAFIPAIKAVEERIERAIAARFDLVWPWPALVHEIDRWIRVDEVRQFKNPPRGRSLFTTEALRVTIPVTDWHQDEWEFLALFHDLSNARAIEAEARRNYRAPVLAAAGVDPLERARP